MADNLTLCVPRPSSGLDPHRPVIVRTTKPTSIPQNHILIEVDRFGFSANNITYQALGEQPHFRYFDFHPPPTIGEVSPKTHGLVPVWGFATVVMSTHPRIIVGERIYGYLAPARYLVVPVSPKDVNKYSFYVPRPHLPDDRRPYNQLQRCASDPQYSQSSEDLTMLYRPLFWTSYWCEDWLWCDKYRGASYILISSASSKTAFCLAYLVGKRRSATRIIGLTSKRNVAFTKGLNLYDEVYDYDSFAGAPPFQSGSALRWLYVDVAGNDALNARIFAHFASPYTGALVGCIALGMTTLSPSDTSINAASWSTNTFAAQPVQGAAAGAKSPFPPQVEHFFMPEWLNVRKHQMTPAEIHANQNTAWAELMRDCVGWVKIERVYGAEAVKKAYEQLNAKGGLGPDKGYIWSLRDSQEGSNMKAKL